MKRSLKYALEEAYSFSEEEILNDSILFIEEQDHALRGNCSAILMALREDPVLAGWKVRWAIPDEISLVNRDILQKQGKIEYLLHGSVGFREALETSRVIITTEMLPLYYIKRPGQTVLMVAHRLAFSTGNLVRKERANLHQTLNVLDGLYLESEEDLRTVRRWFPEAVPFELICAKPPRFLLEKTATADIIVSFSALQMGGGYPVFEGKFKQIRMKSVELGKQFLIQIPQDRYLAYLHENVPDVMERLVGNATPFSRMLRSGAVVLTDQPERATDALQTGCQCILITNNCFKHDGLKDIYGDDLTMTGSFEEALDALTAVASQNTTAAEHECEAKEIRQAVGDLLALARDGARMPEKKNLSVLVVMPAKMSYALWKVYAFCNAEGSPTELFFRETAAGTIWKSKEELPEDVRVFCRTAGGDKINTLLEKSEDFRKEAIRLLGDVHYSEILYVGMHSDFWDQILAEADADSRRYVSEYELLCSLIRKLDNPVLQNTDENILEAVEIDGTGYYRLGKRGSRVYYLKEKAPVKEPVLAFLEDDEDAAACEKLIRQSGDTTFFILDRRKNREDLDVFEERNVYRITDKILPVRLFAACHAVAFCRDETINVIARELGKRLLEVPEKYLDLKKINDHCEVLAAETPDDIFVL